MRKKLIIHIGLYKTGSTALQAFLAQNVSFLAESGIAYPFITNQGTGDQPIAIGNIWLELIRLRKELGNTCSTEEMIRLFLFRALENALKASSQDTTLVSCEHLYSTDALEIITAFSKHCDVSIIAYVRDAYDLTTSHWKQRIKSQGDCRPLDAWLRYSEQDEVKSLLGSIADFVRSGLNVRLLSYDYRRDRLIESFLMELGVEESPQTVDDYHGVTHNRSLSLEQAMLVVMASRDGASSRFSAALLGEFLSSATPFKDPTILEFDERVLARERDAIQFLNSHLPAEQRLRTEPRVGVSLNDLTFSAESVERILSTLARYGQDSRPTEPSAAPHADTGLPRDFDPVEYLLRNPDVAEAGLPADYHYLNHGRWENRVYKADRGEPVEHLTKERQSGDVAPAGQAAHRGRRVSRALRSATSNREGNHSPGWLRRLAGVILHLVKPSETERRRADAARIPQTQEHYETRPKMSSAE